MNDRLEEIEKRLRDAANGPWIHGDKGLYYKNVTDSGYYWQRLSDLPANDELLAHMHEDMNFLIAEVKRLRKQIELEHDQGESFLTQIKELRKDKDRLEKQVELTAYLQANIPFELKAYVQCPVCGESYSSEELIVKNIDGECLDHEEVEQKKGGHN
jgi:hypothetical protein